VKKNIHSNLGRLNTASMQSFSNEVEINKATKNLMVKTEEERIAAFKKKAFDFYSDPERIDMFSYRHYLVLVLMGMEEHFKKLYGAVLNPTEKYVAFYKRRGRKAIIRPVGTAMGSINFLLPERYAALYFDLMHTYYVNEKPHVPGYSISLFFEYIVDYIDAHDVRMADVRF